MSQHPSVDRRTLELLSAHGRVLQLMALNRPLEEIFTAIVRLIETFASGCLSTAYFVEDGKLRLAAAPSWPESFVQAVDGCPIGVNQGTCGTAAFTGTRSISLDVAQDEVWGPFRDWILSYGIRSAWSTPVLSETGVPIATISMCWKELRAPTEWDFEVVETAVKLLSIAVERKRHEDVILEQRMRLAANAKFVAIGEMSANLAHEINSPLAIIQSTADQLMLLARRGTVAEDTVIMRTEMITQTVERISGIIKGLKNLSRNHDQEPLKKVTLTSVINDTLSLCRGRFVANGIRIDVDVEDAELCVPARPVQLCQVLLNLMNNAFDAVSGAEERWVRVQVRREQDRCVLSLIDSGPGVPTQIRPMIMSPFFTTKAAHRGTGLGLSISRQIIESHGGSFILNEDSPHTCFEVRLPLGDLV